jgi:flagellar hook-associated protein 1
MPTINDAFNISRSGLSTYQSSIEVIGNNIANASNEDYTRQDTRFATNETIAKGKHLFGQGVTIEKITRIRDELLDKQIRDSLTKEQYHTTKTTWLNTIESIYNEPSSNGIQNALSQFWESWNELTNNPENSAIRTNLITQTNNLTYLIQNISTKLSSFQEDIKTSIKDTITQINTTIEKIATLNGSIFKIESSSVDEANNLKDQRDAALNKLSELTPIKYKKSDTGEINLFIGEHPLVWQDLFEKLTLKADPQNTSELNVEWEWGDLLKTPNTGKLGALLDIKDNLLKEYQNQINTFSNNLISEVNEIYANGVGVNPTSFMSSNLGYSSLGVTNSSTSLNIVPEGEYGAIHISFYDSDDTLQQMSSTVINSNDSLDDIIDKLSNITPLDPSIITDTNNDGRISIKLKPNQTDDSSKPNQTYTITDNTEAYDTSGFLSLLQFSNQFNKTDNTPQTGQSLNETSIPILVSANTKELELAQKLHVPNSELTTTALGLSGDFSINLFETVTQANKNNSENINDWTTTDKSGFNIQQFNVHVTSTDSMTDIVSTINNLNTKFTLEYFITATIKESSPEDDPSYSIEITTNATTDEDGNLTTPTSNPYDNNNAYVQLSFSNTYDEKTDPPPTNYTGLGDDTHLFAQMQFNTLLQGSDARTIQIDEDITNINQIHAGTKLASGNNTLALMMTNLQFENLIDNNQFTLNEAYENIITQIANDTNLTEQLALNENYILKSFLNEKDSISGVNLDEELSKMIELEKTYQANARMFRTLDQMAQEILNLLN